MKIKFLNNTLQNQRFQYNPMHYDERSEKLDRLKERYSNDKEEMSDDQRIVSMRENMKENWSRSEIRKSHNTSSNIKILLLIGLMLALGYFIFKGVDEVDTVVKKIF